MKCTWFCNCAHLQDFSFFVCSLINCATGEFLGGADRKLAAPPAQSAVPWNCHCGALSLHFVHRRAEVGCGDAGSNALFIFPFLSCPALLSCSSFNAHCMEHTFLTGWPSSEPGMILFSLSPHLCSAGRAVLDTAMNHSTPGGNYLISHPHSCPSLISLCPAARSLVPALFLVTSTVAVLCPESGAPLCLVLCLPWPWGFHTSCPGAFHFTQAIVL